MGKKTSLHIVNIVVSVLGLALVAAGIWYFTQVIEVTSMRSRNYNLLDFNIYWPYVLPWLFIVAGFMVIFVAMCGFSGVWKGSRPIVLTYTASSIITIVVLLTFAIIALIFKNAESTEKFIEATFLDAFDNNYKDSLHPERYAFGVLERKYHCCGAGDPSDYKTGNHGFSQSCCFDYDAPEQVCEYKEAHERYGCSIVATRYSSIAINVMSALAIIIALIWSASLVLPVMITKKMKKKTEFLTVRHETESGKVLL